MPTDDQNDFSERLKRLIETIDVANMLTSPIIASIRSLLESSAAALGSEEASVLVRDGGEGDLKVLIAIGAVAEQLSEIKIPAGKGIAGFVLSSGQPMAVGDAIGEQTFYAEVDKRTGYSTQTILATPLRYEGDVIGVLEYINREGDPPFEPFSPDEMDRAGVYADAIAAMVNAYNSAKLFREFSDKVINSESELALEEVCTWLSEIRESGDHHKRLELAVLLREIAERGDAELQLCREVLEAIVRFSDERISGSYLSF
jgi:signal transduction protein with GAF and PtsI domain